LSDAAELYDQHDVLSKRFEEIVKVVDEVKSLSKEAQPSSHTRSKPVFSKGSDVAKLSAEYKLLNTENAWKLTAAGTGLYKTFFFKTYARCLDFIQIIGINSKARSHHPHMSFKPTGSIKIYWTTHSPPGLSENDIHMAKICDVQAKLLGGAIEPIRPVTPPKTQREETTSVVRKIAVPGS
jgi:4a-hydroxytetrahydrobiopterin dehydratase